MKIGGMNSALICQFFCIFGLLICQQIKGTNSETTSLLDKRESSFSNETEVADKSNPTQPCNSTYNGLNGVISLTDANEACEVDIQGPANGSVVISISGTSDIDEDCISFTVSSVWNDGYAPLYNYLGGDFETIGSIDSISSNVHIHLSLNSTGQSFDVTVSYVVQSRENITTVMSNSSGTIDSGTIENNNEDIINYQHIWLVYAGSDNTINFNLKNVTLNDAAGDFVAIGNGNEALASAPSLVFTGQWTSYADIRVNGTEAYVYLFMKNYSEEYGIIFDYYTSLYIPPTLVPPSTLPPFAILNATIKLDSSDVYYNVTENFIYYITKYAEKYCDEVNELDVVITQVVETKPCIEIIFYIDILNGTCLGSKVFTVSDYKYMMGNYSQDIENEFGRPVMNSCPSNKTEWIVGCVAVAVIALIIAVIAGQIRTENLPEPWEDSGLEEHATADPNFYSSRNVNDTFYESTVGIVNIGFVGGYEFVNTVTQFPPLDKSLVGVTQSYPGYETANGHDYVDPTKDENVSDEELFDATNYDLYDYEP